MALRVYCSSPEELLANIKERISSGRIESWSLDQDGDFCYSPTPWAGKAWMKASLRDDHIVFNILGNTTMVMKKSTYSIYHSRLMEIILTSFDGDFSRISVTAMPISGDVVRKPKEKPES